MSSSEQQLKQQQLSFVSATPCISSNTATPFNIQGD